MAEKPSVRQPKAQKFCKISDGKNTPSRAVIHSRCAACCKMVRCLAAHAAMRSAPRPECSLSIPPLAPPKLHRPRPAPLFRSFAEPPHCRPLAPHAAIIPPRKNPSAACPAAPKSPNQPMPPKARTAVCRRPGHTPPPVIVPQYRIPIPVQSCNPALSHSSVSCAFIQPFHVCRARCTRSFPCPSVFAPACGLAPAYDPAQPLSYPNPAPRPYHTT